MLEGQSCSCLQGLGYFGLIESNWWRAVYVRQKIVASHAISLHLCARVHMEHVRRLAGSHEAKGAACHYHNLSINHFDWARLGQSHLD